MFSVGGKEPTGDPFNSIAKLETTTSKPLNPMINAGALAVTHMIKGSSVSHRFERLLEFVRCLSSNKDIDYNEEIAKSEYETAHLNRALAFL